MAQVGHRELADRVEVVDVTRCGEAAIVGLHRLAGLEVGRDVGDVVAVVGRLGPLRVARPVAAQARLHRRCQGRDLHPGIVVIELAHDAAALRLEQLAQRIAERRLAAVADVQRTGRIGRDEFDQHRLVDLRLQAEALALAQDLADHRLLGRRLQVQVDEAGAGDLERRDPVGDRLLAAQRLDQRLRDLTRTALERLGERHRRGDGVDRRARPGAASRIPAASGVSGLTARIAAPRAASSDCLTSIMRRFYVSAPAAGFACCGAATGAARRRSGCPVRMPECAPAIRAPMRPDSLIASPSLDAVVPPGAGTDLPAQIGKYRVLRRLGDGATSDVFLCHDAFNRREVAIKRLRAASFDEGAGGRFGARFFAAEAALVGRLAASERGADRRRGRRRRPALPGDGVCRRRHAARSLPARPPAAARPGDRPRLQVLDGARLCLPAGPDPPRCQAGQPAHAARCARPCRRRQGQRFRQRAQPRVRRDPGAPGRLAGLHVARAARGRRARRARRHVFAGRGRVPPDRRSAAVRIGVAVDADAPHLHPAGGAADRLAQRAGAAGRRGGAARAGQTAG